MRKLVIAMMLASSQGGCAMWANANATHSHISACVDEPLYSVIDFMIAAGTSAALLATEKALEQPLWLAIPGVFLVSGIVGAVGVHRCRHSDGPRTPPVEYMAPTAEPARSPSPSTSGVPSEAPAESGEEAPFVPAPAGPTLRLPSDYKVGAGVDAGVSDAPPIECGSSEFTTCPAKQTCVLDERNHGHCVPQR